MAGKQEFGRTEGLTTTTSKIMEGTRGDVDSEKGFNVFFTFFERSFGINGDMQQPYMETAVQKRKLLTWRHMLRQCQKCRQSAKGTDGYPCKEGYIFGYSCATSVIKSATDTVFTSIVVRSSAQTETVVCFLRWVSSIFIGLLC